MRKGTLSGKGNFYKGNLHCHSTNSDGKLSVDELVTMYRNQGYHFLCLSEHDKYTRIIDQEYSDENFILLPGLRSIGHFAG
jgi:predicted metal-dependent phosphoesterase TrpH